MSTTLDQRIETSGSVSLAAGDGSAQGADVKSIPVSQNGLSSEPLEELDALAVEAGAGGSRTRHSRLTPKAPRWSSMKRSGVVTVIVKATRLDTTR
ncbi:hypothetical protein [Streptomyces sp. NPDC059460]|uniref:hypothetical protein n=1 Tax=unclassified Streptomyces TaxID=2593676 RepID=UPI0036953E47